MERRLELGGIPLKLSFADNTLKAASMCEAWFEGFYRGERGAEAEIEVSATEELTDLAPEGMIGVLRPRGRLLFDPLASRCRITLLEPALQCLSALHELLWIALAQLLAERGSCFLHAAALARETEAYLFLGDSGAGKSTVARNSPGCSVLSDDAPLFYADGEGYRVFPSPYHQLGPGNGPKPAAHPDPIRPRALFFLVQSNETRVRVLKRSQALSGLLLRNIHHFRHLSPRSRRSLFDLFHRACDELCSYELYFREHDDAWRLAAQCSSGGTP